MHRFVLRACVWVWVWVWGLRMFVHVAFWDFNLINIEIFSWADDKWTGILIMPLNYVEGVCVWVE